MDNTICEAAFLLKTVTEIAFKEINDCKDNIEMTSNTPSSSSPEFPTQSFCDDFQHSESKSPNGPRLRTVSVCSPSLSVKSVLDFEPSPLLPPPMLLCSANQQNIQPISTTVRVCSKINLREPSTLLTCLDQDLPPFKRVRLYPSKKIQSGTKGKSKYVGMHTTSKLKGILQHKFNWKKFPELEELLKQRRDEYLQHSLNFNYTSAQKEYNNKLTREVLERACSLGYIFDCFTFVEVRDRIRCYYKSFVQCQRHKRTEARRQSQDFEDRCADDVLTPTEKRNDSSTSRWIPSLLENNDLNLP